MNFSDVREILTRAQPLTHFRVSASAAPPYNLCARPPDEAPPRYTPYARIITCPACRARVYGEDLK